MTQATSIPIYPSAISSDETPRAGIWLDSWRRLSRNRSALICLAIVFAYFVVGLLGFLPVMTEKITQTVGDSFQPPRLVWNQPSIWFGTDIMGRSVFWQVVYGTRLALILGVVASVISVIIGVALGLLSGYFGGWIDALVTWLFSTFSSVPWILLVIGIASALQTREDDLKALFANHQELAAELVRLGTVILALSLTGWITLCRLVRAEVFKLRERDYVVAGRAIGLRHTTILRRHIIPNIFHIVIINFSLNIIDNVQAEVVLAFIGLSVTQKPSWGRMIDDAKLDLLRGVWWQLAAATMAIFILSLTMNLLGDALRDALDPRLRGVD